MKRAFAWGAVGTAMLLVALTFAGTGGAAALTGSGSISRPYPPPPTKGEPIRSAPTVSVPVPPVDSGYGTGTLQRRAVLEAAGSGCPAAITGTVGSAPSKKSPKGVLGTTSADLLSFALGYNRTRVANCLRPVPLANFRYDSCMEARLFWMAEDPSLDPSSAWGHIGTVRSDGVPSVGCDGNLAGGNNNTGDTVAVKWWQSTSHRTSLYKPTYTGSTASVCIYLAMTHGGIPNEPITFVRAAARWGGC
jgi:hypothetical protein